MSWQVTPWECCAPAIDWTFRMFEQPVRRLDSAPNCIQLSVAHVGGAAMRMTLWARLSREVERETQGRYVVHPIGLTTDDAHVMIVSRGRDHDRVN